MSCYHPQWCFVFYDKKTMTHGHTLVYKDFDYDKQDQLKTAIGTEKSFYNKKLKINELCVCTDAVVVPCGHCVGCSNDISRTWMHRMVLENAASKCAYFLTITYDDKHIPENHMLNKDHLNSFIKSIRNYFKNNYDYDGIRYYACGEYGSKTARPHYHAIIYNMPLTPLEFTAFGFKPDTSYGYKAVGSSLNKEPLFQFDLLNELWQKGFVVVGQVSPASCGYVARYVDKKRMKGTTNKDLEALGIVPEFNCMSRKPGLGTPYYELHYKEILDNNLTVFIDGQSISVGRFFEKFIEKEHPEELDRYKALKDARSIFGKAYISNLDHRSSNTINKELELDEKLKISSYKTLHRNL